MIVLQKMDDCVADEDKNSDEKVFLSEKCVFLIK